MVLIELSNLQADKINTMEQRPFQEAILPSAARKHLTFNVTHQFIAK
jgi:hypothetical protein